MSEFNRELLEAWVRDGVVVLPTQPKGPLPEPPVHLPDGTAQMLLDAVREEAWP